MENTRLEASELWNTVMLDIKKTKSKFKFFIKTINNNSVLMSFLSTEVITHLKELTKLWNNNKNANIDYYFKMKEHHSHINCKITNELLKICGKNI